MRISDCQKTAIKASKKHTPSPFPYGGPPLVQGLSEYFLKEASNILNLSDANLLWCPQQKTRVSESALQGGCMWWKWGGMGGGYGKRTEGMHIFIVSSCNKTRSQDELSP